MLRRSVWATLTLPVRATRSRLVCAPPSWRPRRRMVVSSSRWSAGDSSSVRRRMAPPPGGSSRRRAAFIRSWRSSSDCSISGSARMISSELASRACTRLSSTSWSRRFSSSSVNSVPVRSIGSSSAPLSGATAPGDSERARRTRSWWVMRFMACSSASWLRESISWEPNTDSRSRSGSPWMSLSGRSCSSSRKRRRSTGLGGSCECSLSSGSPSRSSPKRSSVGLPRCSSSWVWPAIGAASGSAWLSSPK